MIDQTAYYKGDKFTGFEEPRYSDREFIIETIEKAPFWARSKLFAKYDQVYTDTLEIQGEQAARIEANTRLRVAVEGLNSSSLPVRRG
jgi:hypothetical protein